MCKCPRDGVFESSARADQSDFELCAARECGAAGSRGWVKAPPPPYGRSEQELSEVAEAPRSGGSSIK